MFDMLRLVLAISLGLSLSGRGSTKCRASAPPKGGRIYSCCGKLGEPRAYYWTGSACVADTFCQCDAMRASPDWPTLRDCERAHRGCSTDASGR